MLVVGGGPAGSCAARAAAAGGASVLLVERRARVGQPVQCAEYVPAQIARYVDLPQRCIAQRIAALESYLPDGERAETPAPGYVIDRACLDLSLVVAAHRAGAQVWTGARAVARTPAGVLVRRGGREVEVSCTVLIGADGPRSTVGRWIDCPVEATIVARQVEVVLPAPRACTAVYFDPLYRGGYGWVFPKGETANVGVGVSGAMGGDPHAALAYLLARLGLGEGAIVGHTGGHVPSGGQVRALRVGSVLLVGDAAGHAHPVTGAGVAPAVISGLLAGEAAARAIRTRDLAALDGYQQEWAPTMGGPMRHALAVRRELDAHWSDDPAALSARLRETWIAFRGYGRRRQPAP